MRRDYVIGKPISMHLSKQLFEYRVIYAWNISVYNLEIETYPDLPR